MMRSKLVLGSREFTEMLVVFARSTSKMSNQIISSDGTRSINDICNMIYEG